jgi:hypothetical protein
MTKTPQCGEKRDGIGVVKVEALDALTSAVVTGST